MKKSPEKRGVHSGPKDASSAYLFFIRVRVTELGSLYGSLSVYTEIIVPWGGGLDTPPSLPLPPPPPPWILRSPYFRPIDSKSNFSLLIG